MNTVTITPKDYNQSLLSNLTGSGNKDGNVTEASEQQDQKKKKGLLGDVMGGLGI